MNKAQYRGRSWTVRQTLRLCFVLAGASIVLATAVAITGIMFGADVRDKNLIYAVLLFMSFAGVLGLSLADYLIGKHFDETVKALPIL